MDRGIRSTPVHPDTVDAPVITLQVPQEWREVPREVFPGVYRAWAKPPADGSSWSDNVLVLVGRLDRKVEPEALLRCGFTDSRRMPDWQEIQADTRSYDGFPSAAITGKYTVDTIELLAHTRYVLIDKGPVWYLVQMTVTVRAATPTAMSDTGQIMNGLSIASHNNQGGQGHATGGRGGVPAEPPGQPRNITTADVRGIGIGLDSSGRLHTLTIDVHAFARGPEALAASIVNAYQQATAALPPLETPRTAAATAPDPSRWRAPAADDYWPSAANLQSRPPGAPSPPPGGLNPPNAPMPPSAAQYPHPYPQQPNTYR